MADHVFHYKHGWIKVDGTVSGTRSADKLAANVTGRHRAPESPVRSADKIAAHATGDQASTPDELAAHYRATVTPTSTQRSALFNYTGGEFVGMNSYLRHGETWANEWAKDPVTAMTALAHSYHLPADTTAYRRVNNDALPSTLKVGSVVHEPGFSSTSLVPEAAASFSGAPNVLQITAPKGTPGIVVNGLGKGIQAEHEFVLPPHTVFKVTGISHRDGARVIAMTVVKAPK